MELTTPRRGLIVSGGLPFSSAGVDVLHIDLACDQIEPTLQLVDNIRQDTELPIDLHMIKGCQTISADVWHRHGVDLISRDWSPALGLDDFKSLRQFGLLCGVVFGRWSEVLEEELLQAWPWIDMVTVTSSDPCYETALAWLIQHRGQHNHRPLVALKGRLDVLNVDIAMADATSS